MCNVNRELNHVHARSLSCPYLLSFLGKVDRVFMPVEKLFMCDEYAAVIRRPSLRLPHKWRRRGTGLGNTGVHRHNAGSVHSFLSSCVFALFHARLITMYRRGTCFTCGHECTTTSMCTCTLLYSDCAKQCPKPSTLVGFVAQV